MSRRSFSTTRREFLATGVAGCAAMAVRADDVENLRQEIAHDHNRPQYHVVPPAHFLNDPNGPLYWRGKYHLFYQYAPGGGMFATKLWYHVVSEDMVHWRNLGIALAPTPGGPDKDGCWTGSAVIYKGVPTLVYTGAFFKGENERADRAAGLIPERQMVAVAADPNDPDLLDWNKIPGNPVIAAPPEGMTVTGWRDPSLWHEGDTWYLIIGSGVKGVGGMALLYRSLDLRHWEYLHPLATAKDKPTSNHPGAWMWECPDFFHLDGKPVLLVAAGNRYLTGTYENLKFDQTFEGHIDYGTAYAQKTMLDAHGRRIWWAWVPESSAAPKDALWSGAISLPRILTLEEGSRLGIEPASELKSLRGKHEALQQLTVTESGITLPKQFRSDCLEIIAEIDPGSASHVGLKVRASQDGEQTLIGYDRMDGSLMSDTRQANKNHPAAGPGATPNPRNMPLKKAPLNLAPGEPLTLHIFLDASVIETFANGRVAIIDRVYPSGPEALGIALFAQGGSAKVNSLQAWHLNPISNDRLTSGPLT